MTSDIYFSCPHCKQQLTIPPPMRGVQVECPTCLGRFVVPKPNTDITSSESAASRTIGLCPYCRSNIVESEQVLMCPSCNTPHHTDCWEENKGCTVYGCDQVPPDEEKISVRLPSSPSESQQQNSTHITMPVIGSPSEAIFLHIPVSRLVFMSIISFGLYNAYWIYRNWRYLKERQGLNIQPFWRGIFGIFYFHGILKAIRDDPYLNKIEPAEFSAGLLATGWIFQSLVGYALGRSTDIGVNQIGTIISLSNFLYFIPVQNYINRANTEFKPQSLYYPWSTGHIICIVFGFFIWLFTLSS